MVLSMGPSAVGIMFDFGLKNKKIIKKKISVWILLRKRSGPS
jgi:hypothetical protein